MRWIRISVLSAFMGALVYMLCSCGGGGSTGSTGTSAGVSLFATDDMSTQYTHVWVTILKVQLTNASGTVTAYSSTTGQQIDVAALHSSGVSSVFAFLANASVPSGTYTSATLTLAPTVTLVQTGSTVSVSKTFSNLDSAGDKDFTVNFSPNQVVSNGSSLVFDFNLAQWSATGSSVTGVCTNGSKTGLQNPSNQVPHDAAGTVSGLTGTAPTQTFSLSTEDNYQVAVTTTATTAISNSDGSTNPVLANGQTVEIQGTYSSTTNSIVATSIVIITGSNTSFSSDARASGTLASYTSSATSFTLTLTNAHHFTPAGTTVTVATTATTKLFGFRGENLTSTEFFALLPSATGISVSGSYASASNTITATVISLQGAGANDPNGVTIRGSIGTGATALSIPITLTQEDGLSLATGTTVTVVPSASVAYYDATGAQVSATTFATDLATATSVSAKGTYNAATTTLTADTIRLFASSTGWDNITLVGTTAAYAADGSFSLSLTNWAYGPFSNGISVQVNVSSSTTYTLASGASTQAAFDAAELNVQIQVTGTLNSDGSLTATAISPPSGHMYN